MSEDIENAAKQLGAEAWKILPPSAGHVVIVFERNVHKDGMILAAIDCGVNPNVLPRILLSQILRRDVAGKWWVAKNLFIAVARSIGRVLKINFFRE